MSLSLAVAFFSKAFAMELFIVYNFKITETFQRFTNSEVPL